MAPPTLVELIDKGGTNLRYWIVFSVMAFAAAIDFFDFFLIGFIMAKLAPEWGLTYGQMSTVLLGAGVGSILGSVVGGRLADRHGRRPVLIWSNVVCGITSASIALVPDGSWLAMAFLRLLAGCALGAGASITLAYVIERTPGRFRTFVVGLNMVAPSAGIGLAAATAGLLLDSYGWRFVAFTGIVPLGAALLIWALCGESVSWLLARNRESDAVLEVQRQLGTSVTEFTSVTASAGNDAQSGLFTNQRRFWLTLIIAAGGTTGLNGVYLWGPALLTMVERIQPAQAAAMFALTSLFGIAGKLTFAFVPQLFGRRGTAIVCTMVGAVSLALAASGLPGVLLGLPMLMVCFLLMSFFLEGGYANIFPFLVEAFPVELAGRGAGLVQAGVGAAKVLGPLSLAVIAGSGSMATPQATANAMVPALLFLALCTAMSFIGSIFLHSPDPSRPS